MVNVAERLRADFEARRKKYLFKIIQACAGRNRCAGCGCKLPGRRCHLKDNLNSETIYSLKEILKKMKGGA